MMDNQLVSVIVPVYNGQKYLDECIDSLINQTYKNIEIICINDGSRDESLAMLLKWSKLDNRIVVIDQPNKGVSCARNEGIKRAKGDRIIFVDCDDTVALDMVERLIGIAKEGIDLVIPKYTREEQFNINSQSNPLIINPVQLQLVLMDYKKYITTINEEYRFANQWELAYSVGRLIRKRILDDNKLVFSTKVMMGEDVLFNYALLEKCNKVALLQDTMYYYRMNEASVTSRFQEKRLTNTIALCEELAKKIRSGEIDDEKIDNAIYQFAYGRVIHCETGYFPYVDKAVRDMGRNELYNIPFVKTSILHGKIRNCNIGKREIPTAIMCKILARL
jgi:glycosyltransferase EpsH